MNEKEIQEVNKLIALFDGYRYMTDEEKMKWVGVRTIERLNKLTKENVPIMTGGKHGVVIYESTLQYHSSWDWLIPAIKKFGKLEEKHPDYFAQIGYAMWDDRVDLAFEILVEAIQWYNTQNK